ncbi:MAG: hypothetical protein LBL66_09310 [Clostridiales bacterium]|jgi:hypothetical protein|nr:hypothetical protein [Clostridiales bacterium]
MNEVFRAECGLFFKPQDVGMTYHEGKAWGVEVGKELAFCPFDCPCTFRDGFGARFPALAGYCEIRSCAKPYDYENSAEFAERNNTSSSFKKATAQYGGYCGAISADHFGGITVTKNFAHCRECRNERCNVTDGKRDLHMCRVIAKRKSENRFGFLKETITYETDLIGYPVTRAAAEQWVAENRAHAAVIRRQRASRDFEKDLQAIKSEV